MNMKITKFLTGITVAMMLVSCSSTQKKDEYKPIEIDTPATSTEGNYELDYSYFRKNNLPIPRVFRGSFVEYLSVRKDTHDKYGYDFFSKFDEEKALKFFKDLNVRGYGDNSPFWRWKLEVSNSDFYTAIKNNLPAVYKARPNEVLTLVGNSWESKPISNNIGNIKKIEVASRGKSAIVTYLIIYTDNATYLVGKELNIRKLFAINRLTTNGTESCLYGAKGGTGNYASKPLRKDITLLPSGYFAMEKSGNSTIIYGGGYGHGVGMSQFAAYDLSTNHNMNYKEILKRHYPNSSIYDMYSLNGVTKYIYVGITNNSDSLEHSKVELSSGGKISISGGVDLDVAVRDKITITNNGGTMSIYVNGTPKASTKNQIKISASGFYIGIHNLKKTHTSTPLYRGEMLISPSKKSSSSVRVINVVKVEDYLKQVVPSEMPQSFGVEALKAQAVAARTYALSDFMKNRYKSEGFHVKDTTESQVYNNQKENDDANKAIELTAGEVLLHNGKPVDAKYFSTGCGFGEAANYVW